jgi:PAS domain S-box-containing protein
MPQDVVHEIVDRTGDVAFRYRLYPTRGCEYVSESVVDLLGYTAEELLSDPMLVARVIHPDDQELMRSVLEAPAGQEVDIELRCIRRDGSHLLTDVRCAVSRDAEGRPTIVDGIARDVTRLHSEQRERVRLIRTRSRAPRTATPARVARVLIVDDHDLTRGALRMVVSDDPHLELVGEARDGREAVALVRRLQPDLVLMDVRMPDLDGLEATRIVKQVSPMSSVLILTMFDDIELLVEAVRAGAAGYVLKSATEADLREAIWAALRGDMPVDPRLTREVLRRLASDYPAQAQPAAPDDPLSPREREVLLLLARGYTNREIGEQLVITANTVKIHVEHILAKLGVSDRTQAAVRAIELGYISQHAH